MSLRVIYIFILSTFYAFDAHTVQYHVPFVVMIDPAGDRRIIEDTYERTLTSYCAERIKAHLDHEGISTCITRTIGNTMRPLQQAHLANHMHVNLFIALHFYHETTMKPHCFIYHFSYTPCTTARSADLAFYPYEYAYLFNSTTSHTWAQNVYHTITHNPFAALWQVHPIIKAPIKSLIGIQVPALAFEIGLCHAKDWIVYVDPIVESIKTIYKSFVATT